ncbi:MAG: glycoside hydrolase family 9 protein [Proteiniphilum sp.]
MKTILTTLFLSLFTLLAAQQPAGTIRLNSLGYLPQQEKEATITADVPTFVVKNAETNETLFSGKTSGPFYQEDTGQEVLMADFSALQRPGSYYLELPDGSRSVTFPLGMIIYSDPFRTAMRGFYLWRCGMAVAGEHNGEHFCTEACHLEDGYLDYLGEKGVQRDGTGGWHDAGDHGKYIVNAGITMGILSMAWEQFQPQIEKIDLQLPETAPGLPPYLQELKWEMDWVLKMQYADGSGRVSHKLTRTNFSGFIMPQDDKEKRYFTEWSSAATASFAAMTAQAARIFAPYDQAYADRLLAAARLSYDYLQKHPEEKPFIQGDFQTGGYQTTDPDDRLWAAAELWQTTGEEAYLRDFEQRAAAINYRVDEDWDWGNVANLGMFTYLLSEREGKDKAAEKRIRENALKAADNMVTRARNDAYGRSLVRYYWGCNGSLARQTLNLYVAERLRPENSYRETALTQIAHLFGRNYYNRSYVTGLGINPPKHPHDRRSGADTVEAPWPGYLVGGGHSATDWVDEEESYSHNEIAINWQASLLFALAWMLP